MPPRTAGVCDRCGGELYQREDDSETAVAKRLDVYGQQTTPLLDYYKNRGILSTISGEGAVPDVTAAIRKAVGEKVPR
jgi:adenylate kinase